MEATGYSIASRSTARELCLLKFVHVVLVRASVKRATFEPPRALNLVDANSCQITKTNSKSWGLCVLDVEAYSGHNLRARGVTPGFRQELRLLFSELSSALNVPAKNSKTGVFERSPRRVLVKYISKDFIS
jgi:hypothetical protein